MKTAPFVFISYSHDSQQHKERVLELSERLRSHGVDAIIDQYMENDAPPEGWPRWMDEQLRTADFVLLVCTSNYRKRVEGREEPGKGHGVLWEGTLIYQLIYNAGTQNDRFIPVLLEGCTRDDIPLPLQGVASYSPLDEAGYESLYRRLTGQPMIQRGEIGEPIPLPPRKVAISALPESPGDANATPSDAGRESWVKRPAVWAGLALALGLAGFAVIRPGKDASPPPPVNPDDFRLSLQVRLDENFGPVDQPPQMRLLHRLPRNRGTNLLEGGRPLVAKEYEYESPVRLPAPGEEYQGLLHRLVTSSVLASPSFNTVCFGRNEAKPHAELIVRVKCREGGPCEIANDDFGWAKACARTSGSLRWPWELETVHAQQRAPEKGWIVPAVETLREQLKAHQNPAFTEFFLTSGPLSAVKEANKVSYEVRVNGKLIYIDGLPADVNVRPFNPAAGLDIQFGLENLDFSGHEAGFETIEVTLRFLNGNRAIRTSNLRMNYTALRTSPEKVAPGDRDLPIQWRAVYHAGRKEDVYQIFLTSTPVKKEAENNKRRIDAAKFQWNGIPLVAVVRPPLETNPNYGLAVGVLQPTGQVKFTFDDQMSRGLCLRLNELAVQSRLIDKRAYRRSVDSRRSTIACAQIRSVV